MKNSSSETEGSQSVMFIRTLSHTHLCSLLRKLSVLSPLYPAFFYSGFVTGFARILILSHWQLFFLGLWCAFILTCTICVCVFLFPRKQESGDGIRSVDLPFVGEDEVLS